MFKVLGIIALLLIAVLVFQDAKTRNMNPWVWGILTVVFPVVTIIIYFIIRKQKLN